MKSYLGLSLLCTAYLGLAPSAAARTVPTWTGETSRVTAQEVRAIVQQAVEGKNRPRRKAKAELRALDHEAIPALLEVFAGRDLKAAEPTEISDEPLFEIPPPPPWLNEVLLETIELRPAEEVSRAVERFLDGSTVDERVLVFQVIERIDHRDAVDLWLDLVANIPSLHYSRAYVANPMQHSLATVLRDVPASINRLSKRVNKVDEALLPMIVRSIAIARVAQGTDLLRELYGDQRELDLELLDAGGRLERFDDDFRLEAETRWIREALEHTDPAYRARASVALGRLHAAFAVNELIARLSDEDRSVRRSALWALQELSGNAWSGDAKRWSDWWASEENWLNESFDSTLDGLRSDDPARKLAALDALSLHPVYAPRIVRELSVLQFEDPTLAKRAQALRTNFETRINE